MKSASCQDRRSRLQVHTYRRDARSGPSIAADADRTHLTTNHLWKAASRDGGRQVATSGHNRCTIGQAVADVQRRLSSVDSCMHLRGHCPQLYAELEFHPFRAWLHLQTRFSYIGTYAAVLLELRNITSNYIPKVLQIDFHEKLPALHQRFFEMRAPLH